jgi:hypothetical protein
MSRLFLLWVIANVVASNGEYHLQLPDKRSTNDGSTRYLLSQSMHRVRPNQASPKSSSQKQEICPASCGWEMEAGISVSWYPIIPTKTLAAATEIISKTINHITVTTTISASLPYLYVAPLINSLGTQIFDLGGATL